MLAARIVLAALAVGACSGPPEAAMVPRLIARRSPVEVARVPRGPASLAEPVLAQAALPAARLEEPAPAPARARTAGVRPGGREFFSGPRDRPRIALTFDDGPSRENTPRVLEVLAEQDAVATFFVLGDRVAREPGIVEAIARGGHEIGNHTRTHGSMRSMFPSEIEAEIDDTNRAIEEAAGVRPTLFRPPFGRYAPTAVPLVARRGMDLVLWTLDSEDWSEDAEHVAEHVVERARAGDIVLLHDRGPVAARALPRIVQGLRARGFALVTVSELLNPE
jgi:peptidoglycan-N-acetylglucosamine deacetylase